MLFFNSRVLVARAVGEVGRRVAGAFGWWLWLDGGGEGGDRGGCHRGGRGRDGDGGLALGADGAFLWHGEQGGVWEGADEGR